MDEVLRKYGVLEASTRQALPMYDAFLAQAKHELKEHFIGIFECIQRLAEEEAGGKGEIKRLEGDKSCERIMAEYLQEMAAKVSQKFFVTLIMFTRLYKDGMNVYGWDILSKYKPVSPEERKDPFVKFNNAEHVPEACNDFIRIYLPRVYPNIEQTIAIDLTYHFCDWLYRRKYTHSKISRI